MKNPFRKRYDKEATYLTAEQQNCTHIWERMAESRYSRCRKCELMRHDDGDLINPKVYAKYLE